MFRVEEYGTKCGIHDSFYWEIMFKLKWEALLVQARWYVVCLKTIIKIAIFILLPCQQSYNFTYLFIIVCIHLCVHSIYECTHVCCKVHMEVWGQLDGVCSFVSPFRCNESNSHRSPSLVASIITSWIITLPSCVFIKVLRIYLI